MIDVKQKENCCGCHACYSICPQSAIEMVIDDKGFKYPKINKEKCINCGLCEKVCPILNNKECTSIKEAYACINKDESIRLKSSSGGMFSLIAEEIILKNGVVFGAKFDKNFNVTHSYVDKVEDLNNFRGSKYVQSTIDETYKQAKIFLENDRFVLFTGTPCQIEGLYSYLQKDYEKLYTQDIICHGVPSPKVWDKYKRELKEKYKSPITDVCFRDKHSGWKRFSLTVKFKDNKKYTEENSNDKFMQFFLKNICLRDSCYDCKFKKKNRISDVTLADFWGISQVDENMDDNKGTSLVIINTNKGKKLFDTISNKVKFKKADFEEAIQYNPNMTTSVKMPKNRNEFFENMDKMPVDELVKKYVPKTSLFRKIIFKLKRIVKKILD